MVQDFRIGKPKFAADATEAQVPRAEHKTCNTRGDQRSGAHYARFESTIQRCPFQPVIVEGLRGFTEREYFSVRRRIVARDGGVVSSADDLIPQHNDRASGDFTRTLGFAGKLDGLIYKELVARIHFDGFTRRIFLQAGFRGRGSPS